MLNPIPGLYAPENDVILFSGFSVAPSFVLPRANARILVILDQRIIPEIQRRQGDRLPKLSGKLVYDDLDPVILTGCTMAMNYRLRGEMTGLVKSVSILDSLEGTFEYNWDAEDAAVDPGRYNTEFQISYPNGQTMTVPTKGYIPQIVWGELDS